MLARSGELRIKWTRWLKAQEYEQAFWRKACRLEPAGHLYLAVNVHSRWGAFLHGALAAFHIDKGHPYTFTSRTFVASWRNTHGGHRGLQTGEARGLPIAASEGQDKRLRRDIGVPAHRPLLQGRPNPQVLRNGIPG